MRFGTTGKRRQRTMTTATFKKSGQRSLSLKGDTANMMTCSQLPYHGAQVLLDTVRTIIASIPKGSEIPMSARRMMLLLQERGFSVPMSKRLFSQVRKGAALHLEWKEAFSTRKFKYAPASRKKNKEHPKVLEELDNHFPKTPSPPCFAQKLEFEDLSDDCDSLISSITNNPWSNVNEFDQAILDFSGISELGKSFLPSVFPGNDLPPLAFFDDNESLGEQFELFSGSNHPNDETHV